MDILMQIYQEQIYTRDILEDFTITELILIEKWQSKGQHGFTINMLLIKASMKINHQLKKIIKVFGRALNRQRHGLGDKEVGQNNQMKWLIVGAMSLIICALIILSLLWISGSFEFSSSENASFLNDGIFLALLIVVSMAISYFYLYKL